MSSNLALPPLTGMPPDVQAAFRAVAAWAKSSGLTASSQAPSFAQPTQAVVASGGGNGPSSSAHGALSGSVPTVRNEAIIRSIFSNSSLLAPIQLNSSVVFQAGNSTTGVGIGAGGIIGKNMAYAYTGYEGYTFGISAADGSFFFGPQVDDPDPTRKQIVFDVGSGIVQFGKDIIVKTSGGDKTLDQISTASGGYTKTNLESDLASGVASVLAGQGGDYRLHVDPSGSKVVMYHKDAVFGGMAAAGSVKPALGITASGIAMGYNRSSDGAWVNSVAIDAAGNASFAGSVNATSGNFAESITVGGVTLATIKANAAAGAAVSVDLSAKLEASSSYILGGTMSVTSFGGIRTGNVAWDSNGNVNAGSGIAITSKGIVGVSSNQVTFSLNGATGEALFKGAVDAQATTSDGSYTFGIKGTSATSGITYGVIGASTSYGGVLGYSGSGTGVRGFSGSGPGVLGVSTSGYAVHADGDMYIKDSLTWRGMTYSYPSGAVNRFPAADGNWKVPPNAVDSDTLDGYHATSFLRYVGPVTSAGTTVAGKSAYWAVINVGSTNYNILVGV